MSPHRRIDLSACLRLAVLVALLGPCVAPAPAHADGDPVAAAIGRILAEPSSVPAGRYVQMEQAALVSFYAKRNGKPLWVSADGALPRARALIGVLRSAAREGLDPMHYGPETLAARLDTRTISELAALDLLLSAEFLHFAGELRRGRLSPQKLDPDLFVQPDAFDRAAALAGVATADDVAAHMRNLAPANAPYHRLRRALAEYRDFAAVGGWPVLADGPSLKPGMRGPRIETLRARLEASGDLTERNGDRSTFDDLLLHAVVRFQSRHGLEPDGVVGPKTRRELNVPVAERIRQIEINMERWRWMPDDLGIRHILVNLAGFEVDAIDSGSTALHMRAVVGLPYRRTPVFSDTMTYLEINPTWTVPPSIARLDLLPKVRKNPAYLAENGFTVYAGWTDDAAVIDPATVNWETVDARRMPFRFVQAPGELNALGRIKFMFPNRFNVYLHDTPHRELFDRTVRTFSSGCIRVEQPMALARYLLAGDPGWTPERVEQAIAEGATRRVVLPDPIPVHLTYATAWVGEGGWVHFRQDVYERDAALSTALYDRPADH